MKLRIGIVLVAAVSAAVLSSRNAVAESACPAGPRLAPIVYRGVNLPPPGQSKPVPLVIALHGSSMTPSMMEQDTGLDHVADVKGFVVAYLGSQTPTRSSWTRCNMSANLAYISSEITQLTASQHIDPSRVYVTGFSAGATMSFYVGCALSKQVAAIAPVSGWMQNGQSCQLVRPESMILIIGTNDAAPITGTRILMSASGMASRWQRLDGCNLTPQVATTSGPVDRSVWSQCDDASGVGLDVIQGGTHNWPPNGPTDRALQASQEIWTFFAAHPAMSATAPSVKLTTVSVQHSRRSRWVRLAMSASEGSVSLTAVLRYGSRRIASKVFSLSRGQKTIALAIRKTARAGRYRLTLVFTDSYGRRSTMVRVVIVPKPPN